MVEFSDPLEEPWLSLYIDRESPVGPEQIPVPYIFSASASETCFPQIREATALSREPHSSVRRLGGRADRFDRSFPSRCAQQLDEFVEVGQESLRR